MIIFLQVEEIKCFLSLGTFMALRFEPITSCKFLNSSPLAHSKYLVNWVQSILNFYFFTSYLKKYLSMFSLAGYGCARQGPEL